MRARMELLRIQTLSNLVRKAAKTSQQLMIAQHFRQLRLADSCSRRPVERPMVSSNVMARGRDELCAYHAGFFFLLLNVHWAHRTLNSLLEVCVTGMSIVSDSARAGLKVLSYTSSCLTSAISATASSSSLVFFDLTAGRDSL